jgi:hypothetical protein
MIYMGGQLQSASTGYGNISACRKHVSGTAFASLQINLEQILNFSIHFVHI